MSRKAKKKDKISEEQYLLQLPPELAGRHQAGDLYIHDLENFGTRPFSHDWDLRYFYYYGLMPDGNGTKASVAGPAKRPEIAILHAVKALGSAQTNFAGGQGYYNFLTFLAPYMEGTPYDDIKQMVQMFVYEMTQMMVASGDQLVSSSIQLSPGVPALWQDKPCVYKGKVWNGIYAPKRTYGEFEREVRLLFKALMEVMLEGDYWGKPFNFLQPEISIEPEFMTERDDFNRTHPDLPNYKELYLMTFELASKFGTPNYDNQLPAYRGAGKGITCYQSCAYQFSAMADNDPEFDKKLMFDDGGHFSMGSWQIVSVNCPRAAYNAEGDDARLFAELTKLMDVSMEIFKIKRRRMDLIRTNNRMPFAMQHPKDPNTGNRGAIAVDLDRLVYVIGVAGVNEMVQHHTGKQLHESKGAFKLAIRAMVEMDLYARKLSQKNNMMIALARAPAETIGQRFAVADLLDRRYHKYAVKVIKGNLEDGLQKFSKSRDLPIYYTDGMHVAMDADVSLTKRMEIEHVFFPIIDGGNIFHIWLGEARPDPQILMDVAMKLCRNTQIGYFAFSRDLTVSLRQYSEFKKKESLVRLEVIDALGEAFPHVPDRIAAWDDLHHLIVEGNILVRLGAIDALGKVFPHVPDQIAAWDDLHHLIAEGGSSVRWKAAIVLGKVFPHVPDRIAAWDDLHNLTGDEDALVRIGAVDALGKAFPHIPDRKAAWEDLNGLAFDKDAFVRRGVASALGLAYPFISARKAARKTILRLTQDPNHEVRIFAYHSAGKASIQDASQLKDDDAFRLELENALTFFERSYREAENTAKHNPAQICYPLYRALHAVIFLKKDSKANVEEFLSDAKIALSGSDTRKQLLAIIENLANAIKEVEDLSSVNPLSIRSHLITINQYCSQAEAIIESVEGEVPGTARVMRRGAQIVGGEIETIKNQIYILAEEICLLVKNKGSPYKDFGCEIYKLGKQLRDGKDAQKVIREEFPKLKQRIPEILPEIMPDLELPFEVIRKNDIPNNQFSIINNIFLNIRIELQNAFAGLSDNWELTSAVTNLQGQLDDVRTGVRDIDADIHNLQKTVLSRFDETELRIQRLFISNLDNNQKRITTEIIDALNNQKLHRKERTEIENIAKEMYGTLKEIQCTIIDERDELADAVKTFIEMQKSSDYNARHRIVLTLWLIPLLLNYQVIHEVQANVKIRTLWDRLKNIGTRIPKPS